MKRNTHHSSFTTHHSSLVPRLRFPEFRDAGPWEVKRLGDVAEVNAAGDLDFSQFSPVLTQEHIYPIYSNSIAQEGLYGFSTYPKYKKNSVTITARGTLGVAFYRDHDFVGIGRLLIVNARQEISPRYLKEVWNYLVREPFENGGIPQLTAIKARTIKLVFPSLPEQQKIADCLSSLDEVIELEAKKLEALKAHKKGLMQQLFPREGETTPRLRFPEFRNAGPWEVKRLGEVCHIQTGKKDANEGNENGPYPFFTCAENHIYSSSYSFDCEAILVAGNANVGQTKYYNGKFEAYQRTYVLCDFSNINTKYLYAYLSDNLQLDMTKEVQTSAMSYIKLPMLKNYIVPTPSKEEEQQKIADCLSSLDELIELEAKKLDALKAHKKGLMQQLFPQEISA